MPPGIIDPARLSEVEVARRLLANVENLTKNYADLTEQVTNIQGFAKRFEGLDPSDLDMKAVFVEWEKIKAFHEEFAARIRSSHNGMHIPGLGEEKQEFSIIKALCGAYTGDFETYKAGYELEVLKAYREKLAQVGGIQSAGGFFIPDEVLADVIPQIFTRSVLINLDGDGMTRVSVLDGLVGGTVKVPKFIGGVIAYWIGEGDEFVESRSKVGDISMTPKKMGILIRLTEEMRRMAAFGFESLLRQDMVRAGAKELDRTILYGRGSSNEPRGVINAIDKAKIVEIETNDADINVNDTVRVFDAENNTPWAGVDPADAAGGELSFDGLDEMMGMLEDRDIDVEDSAAIIAPPRFIRRLRQLKITQFSGQTSEKAYLIGVPRLPDERMAEIVGPFDKTTQIKTKTKPGTSLNWPSATGASKFGDVFFGNWSELLFGRWGGLEIDTDEGKGKGFTSDHIYVKLRMWCDIGFRHPQAIVVCPDAQMRD